MVQLKKYVADLKSLLLEGEYFERRAFLKSFIKRVNYDYPQVSVQYKLPVMKLTGGDSEVLGIDKISGPDLTLPKLWPASSFLSGYTLLLSTEVGGKQSSARMRPSRIDTALRI